jgi:SAM-dependent methyltransferase
LPVAAIIESRPTGAALVRLRATLAAAIALSTSPFDRIPEVYDRIRPQYPPALYDELFTRLPEAPEVLEIGPGTGQATIELLSRGARVTAVELGPNMAAFLRRKFEGNPALSVINAGFESADLPRARFDLVLSATAFHWLDPAVRLSKPAELLGTGGIIAVIETVQVASDVDRGYFARSQTTYDKYWPGEPESPPISEDDPPAHLREIADSLFFEDARSHYWRWDQRYSTAEYADLVRSYSNTQMLEPTTADALIADLSALIDAEFDGYVVRPLVITLVTARKRL